MQAPDRLGMGISSGVSGFGIYCQTLRDPSYLQGANRHPLLPFSPHPLSCFSVCLPTSSSAPIYTSVCLSPSEPELLMPFPAMFQISPLEQSFLGLLDLRGFQ